MGSGIMVRSFSIREAKNTDIPYIKLIVFTVLKEYGLVPDEHGKDKDLDDIENNYLPPYGFFGIVTDDKEQLIVGTFGIAPHGEDLCELRKMYLLKNARGKGAGTYMLQFAIDKAKETGYKKMRLETISPLKEAISLYQKFGFIEIVPQEISSRVDKAFELDLSPKG